MTRFGSSFGNTQISGIMAAIAAFTLITGAGVAGNLKGAIDTVDRRQLRMKGDAQ